VPRLLLLAALACVALAGDVVAGDRKTITVKLPRFTMQPGSNIELCYFLRIPTTTPFEMGGWRIQHPTAKGGLQNQHGLVYLYTGERGAEFQSGALVQSRGCLDMGPGDRDRRVLIASSSARKIDRVMPAGVAVELAPAPDAPGGAPAAIGILVDVNWANNETRAKAVTTKVVLKRAKKVKRTARPISDTSAAAGIFAPPFTRHSTAELVDARWAPAADACVLGLSGQMHRRGKCIGVDQLDGTGQVKPATSGLPNPCEPDRRLQLFVGSDFTDPGALSFTSPLTVRAGESLRYACWVDNGVVGGTVRLGCETSPGVTPGSVEGGPAALCSIAVPASSECPGQAACVPANAVAGPTADDELCGLTALVYDAAPGGNCDVSSLP
jgi:hypothetical protein